VWGDHCRSIFAAESNGKIFKVLRDVLVFYASLSKPPDCAACAYLSIYALCNADILASAPSIQKKKKEDYEGAFDAMHELLRLYQCVCPENQQLLHPYIASGSAPNSMLEGQVPDYRFSG
jgi:hypothetical protein